MPHGGETPSIAKRSRLHLGRMRRLSPEREALLSSKLPSLRVTLGENESLDPLTLCDTPIESVWLEIGFGAGEHLLYQARAHPKCLHIGCEPYPAGVARLLADMDGVDNIRIYDGDALDVLSTLMPSSISRCYMMFPDPWPKKRHGKRRMTRMEIVKQLARIMKKEAELRVATDSVIFTGWMLANMRRCAQFVWDANCARDWREALESYPPTRYEFKARRSGRDVMYLNFRRLDDSGLR